MLSEPIECILVHYTETPPKTARRVDDYTFHDPVHDLNFCLWRNRWCVVVHEAMEAFVNLDNWLKDPAHGLVFEQTDVWN